MSTSVVLLGNGGHAKVIKDMIDRSNDLILAGILDDNISEYTEVDHVFYDKMSNLSQYLKHKFVIAIGNNKVRLMLIDKYQLNESHFVSVIDSSAIISPSAHIGIGTVVMPRAVINANAEIGNHVIINSGSIIEHDNIIEDFVHISPGAVLSGTVTIKTLTHIGSNTTIIPNIVVGASSVIGAGSVVIRDISDEVVAVGNPAKVIKNNC
ncbi:acetyltransferase [Macrococcus sp. DPC7161]|uniref:acetyltransferase n=1 Tax=Macrococcus sp. DPC7161 TaxID=2507060 RepID=UPI00100B884D|nr:acetyltransferase [Macrococcus sp. DPC7161]RXK17234.1 acetyltransferase [Macrococcus sp. DPC7161]